MREKDFTSLRILYLLGGGMVIFSLLVLRLFYMQLVQAPKIIEKNKIARTYYLPLPPTRGYIVDRNDRPLAMNANLYSVEVDKTLTEDVEASIRRAGKVLNIADKECEQHVAAMQNPKIVGRVLQRGITEETKKKIEAENIPGIHFNEQPIRFYPERGLAAQLIGYTGTSNDGLEGIEFAQNDKMRGNSYPVQANKDINKRLLAEDDYTKIITRGANVVLSIDSYIQFIVEREIEKARVDTGALFANAVVIHPKSGEILALANAPAYDPNHYQDYSEIERKNHLITDVYEPGSIIKPFTIIAALDRQVVTPETKFFCENGRYFFRGHTIRDDIHSFADLTVHDIIVHSSNIGTVKIAQQLAPDDWKAQANILYDYLRRFGFKDSGEKTLVEFPGDSGGILRPPQNWTPSSMGSIPYGQEMAANSLTLAVAYTAIANRGIFQPPQIIKGYRTKENYFIPKPSKEAYRIVRQDVMDQVVRMMTDVTERPDGSGRLVRIPGFHIAGKTGTAQKIDKETGTYGKGMRIASFAGFFPAEDPKAVIVVMVDEPKKKKYGGEVAGPAWKAIAEELIAYWGLSPSYKDDPLLVQAPVTPGQKKTPEDKMKSEMDKSRMFGVTQTMRVDETNPPKVEKGVMPNLKGLPIRDAYTLLAKQGLTAMFAGTGKVTVQQIPAGTPLAANAMAGEVTCEPMLTDPEVKDKANMLARS